MGQVDHRIPLMGRVPDLGARFERAARTNYVNQQSALSLQELQHNPERYAQEAARAKQQHELDQQRKGLNEQEARRRQFENQGLELENDERVLSEGLEVLRRANDAAQAERKKSGDAFAANTAGNDIYQPALQRLRKIFGGEKGPAMRLFGITGKDLLSNVYDLDGFMGADGPLAAKLDELQAKLQARRTRTLTPEQAKAEGYKGSPVVQVDPQGKHLITQKAAGPPKAPQWRKVKRTRGGKTVEVTQNFDPSLGRAGRYVDVETADVAATGGGQVTRSFSPAHFEKLARDTLMGTGQGRKITSKRWDDRGGEIAESRRVIDPEALEVETLRQVEQSQQGNKLNASGKGQARRYLADAVRERTDEVMDDVRAQIYQHPDPQRRLQAIQAVRQALAGVDYIDLRQIEALLNQEELAAAEFAQQTGPQQAQVPAPPLPRPGGGFGSPGAGGTATGPAMVRNPTL